MEWNYLWAKVNGEFKVIEVFSAPFGEAWDLSIEKIKSVDNVDYWDVSTSFNSEIQAWQTAKAHKESYAS